MAKDKVLGSVSSTGSLTMWSGERQRDRAVFETKAQIRPPVSSSHLNRLSFPGNINGPQLFLRPKDLCKLLQGRQQGRETEKQNRDTQDFKTNTSYLYICSNTGSYNRSQIIQTYDPRKCVLCIQAKGQPEVLSAIIICLLFMRRVLSSAWSSPNRWGWLDSKSQGYACPCLPSA